MSDELTNLIRAVNDGPLPWGKQKRLVDLCFELFEKQGNEHKIHVEKLERIISNYKENAKIEKEIRVAC